MKWHRIEVDGKIVLSPDVVIKCYRQETGFVPPGPGWAVIACPKCDKPCWFGPRSRQRKNSQPEVYQVMCDACSDLTMKAIGGEKPEVIKIPGQTIDLYGVIRHDRG